MAARAFTYARALALWARKYPLAPRYAAHERVTLTTADGLRVAAARLHGPSDASLCFVVVHGFLNSSRSPLVYAFARELARREHVIVPDLRGHGGSEGETTLGTLEPLDVAAAVRSAPAGLPVVTVGTSLGGSSVLRHAALFGGVAGVVAVSSPAWWYPRERPGAERVYRLVTSRRGRSIASRLLGTRIGVNCEAAPEVLGLVGRIAPAFTVIVHDPEDHYFGEEHARLLYEAAGDPKALWLAPGAGHGSDLLTPAFAARVLDEAAARVLR